MFGAAEVDATGEALQADPHAGEQPEDSGDGTQVAGREAQEQLDRAADEHGTADDQEDAGDQARQGRAAARGAAIIERDARDRNS